MRMKKLAAASAATVLAWGCSQAPEPSVELEQLLETQAAAFAEQLEDAASGPLAPGELVVRLAFGAEADLDLYVTDPLAESIYFANRDARSGGKLTADVRCDSPEPRIEEVRFATPLPGRYRIGVDHPTRCDGAKTPTAYAVSVQGAGLSNQAGGSIALSQFDVIVMEFEVTP